MAAKRRLWLASAITCVLMVGGVTAARAQPADSYPSKPITIVSPFAAGGSSDMVARLVAEALQKAWGQSVIVETRTGAGGSIGVEHVVRSPADGYTLALTSSGTTGINPYTYKLRYRPMEDLAQISILVDLPFVVVTNPQFPARTLKEFVAYAKQKPGAIKMGNGGIGTHLHLAQMMFLKALGIDVNVVSYKGSIPAVNDLLGGHIDAMMDNTGVQKNYIDSGKVNALLMTSDKRIAALPNVPTAQELGVSFAAAGWYGLAAPKGTPPQIIERIQRAVAQHMAQPEVQKKLSDVGITPLASTPEFAIERARSDFEKFGVIARELNLKPM